MMDEFNTIVTENIDMAIIENELQMLLKGVSQHSSKDEIKARLLESKIKKRPLRIKLGLDPSAPDIHLGHAVVLRKIRQLQDLGHTAQIIIGDFTGMIGDPTGKSKTRNQLSEEEVKLNSQTYFEQIFKILDKSKTEVHFNSSWLSKMNFQDVINLCSKMTVARMLERDDFQKRYHNHQPLSIHEFFYPLMQAYDSVVVKADIELGGTDQVFNIHLGRQIQKEYGVTSQLTLFMPLLEGIDGIEKMSKSLGNYVGINEKPYIMYEKIMQIPDEKIIKYFNLCTDLHPDKVMEIELELENGRNPRDIKMDLAKEIVTLYHNKYEAEVAQERFKTIFQKNQVPDDIPQMTINSENDILIYESILSELVRQGFYQSKSEIRRLIAQGAVKLDGKKVSKLEDIVLEPSCSQILKIGKRNLFKLCIMDKIDRK